MQLARVIGTVVATVKNEALEGRKLLVVQTLNKDLKPNGKPMVRLMRSARALANWFSGAAEKKRAFLSNAKTRRPTARSSASSIRMRM